MLTWLAAVLRAAGLAVIEVPGWASRGHGPMGPPLGVLMHHTAGPATGSFPSLGVVRDGRPGLLGPLANLGLSRDGAWLTIAAGRAYHAGAGVLPWCPRDRGNDFLIGVEAESTGRGDWTPAQLVSYPRGVAALLRYLELPAARAAGHKEWAPARKIDPAGWPGDMAGFRATVAAHLAEGVPDVTPDDIAKIADAVRWNLVAFRDDRSANRNLWDSLLQVLTNQGQPLSDAEVNRIAARVVQMLADKTA